uniref:Rep protein n=1 Tax=Paenibacillus popilliae TaxID=78057 RepID=Q005X3_PAEPP|nr:Rep protein [Paenibacillus popilliae]
MSIVTDKKNIDNDFDWDSHYKYFDFLGAPQPMEEREVGEQLVDLSSTGKIKPWIGHKSATMLLSESFYRLGKLNKAESVLYCGTRLKFACCPEGHYKRLKWASFCRVRLCPMCGWRRSLKVAHQVKRVAHTAMESANLRWVFLTLTVRNVSGDKLSDEMDHLTKSFRRFFQRKRLKKIVLGFFRGLEVTYNKDKDTYHPHYHVLLAVTPSYFDGKSYIKKSEWSELWRDAARLDYDPIVDVRVVKDGRRLEKEQGILVEKGYIDPGIISEMSKYTVKAADYLVEDDVELTDKVVSTLERALLGRRLFAFGGMLKDVYEWLKNQDAMDDAESDKACLVKVDDDLSTCTCPTCNSTLLEEMYRWLPDRGAYHR